VYAAVHMQCVRSGVLQLGEARDLHVQSMIHLHCTCVKHTRSRTSRGGIAASLSLSLISTEKLTSSAASAASPPCGSVRSSGVR
jgi:hypothetical protein